MNITPYSKNAKKHPKKQVEQIANSIKEFGMNQPIVVDKQGVIIVGHGRYEALKLLGMPIKDEYIKVVDLSEEQARSYRLADNKLNESEWDMNLVLEELKGLTEPYLELTGFDKDLVIEPDEADDEVPDVPEEPQSKLGDLYELGNHRVLCGDSTKLEDVERLMDGKKADMVFTDPPYGMKKEKEGVLNDNLNYDELLEFNKAWIPLTFDFMKEVGSWYCWGIDEPLMDIYSHILKPMAREQKLTFRNLITWDKGHGQGQKAEEFRSYAVADEKCLFVMGGVQGFNNNSDNYYEGWEPVRSYLDGEMEKVGGRKVWKDALGNGMGSHYFTKSQWVFPTKEAYGKLQAYAKGDAFKKDYDEIKKDYDEIKKDYDEIKKEWQSTRAYFDNTHDNMNNVWHFDRTSQEEREGTGEHATPKPLALCSRAIKSSTRSGGTVLDVFLGSGSTLIAAEKTGRICYGMELDCKYTDVIVERWCQFTGIRDIIKNGEKHRWEAKQ